MPNKTNAKETEQLNVRVSEETKERFREISAEFNNQTSAMEALVATFQLAKCSQTLPDNARTIDDVQTHLYSIERCVISLVESIGNSDKRIRMEYAQEIERLTIENNSLREKVQILTETNKIDKERAEEAEKNLADTKAAMQAFDDLHDTFTMIKEENKKLKEAAEEVNALRKQLADVMIERDTIKLDHDKYVAKIFTVFATIAAHKGMNSDENSMNDMINQVTTEINEQISLKMEEVKTNEMPNA